ncbi:MAG: hypothetical protein KGK07_13785 [Chloroflexota bacterium]|nr:hypothetical protein [Chloroflexota bacterium]
MYVGQPGMKLRHLITLPTLPPTAWSPDGALLALGGLLVNATTGKTVADLRLPDATPAWSSDGAFLAMLADPNVYKHPKIAVWNRSTGVVTDVYGFNPAWANRSSELAYQAPAQGPGTIETRVYNAVTGTNRLVQTVDGTTHGAISWSSDDHFLASQFHVTRGNFWTDDLYVVRVASGQRSMVVHGAWSARWLNQQTLFFVGSICANWDIYTVHADGSGLQNRTHSPDVDLDPKASPDGKTLMFDSYPRLVAGIGAPRVRLLDTETGETRDVIAGSALGGERWSPNGRYLAVGVLGGHGLCDHGEPQTTSVETGP